jgi:hypothetical protein
MIDPVTKLWQPSPTWRQAQPVRRQLEQQRQKFFFPDCTCCGLTPCECSDCADPEPAQYSLSVSGVTDSGACTVCNEEYNGDYTLTQDCLVFESGSGCLWSSPFTTNTPCDPGCSDCPRYRLNVGATFTIIQIDTGLMGNYRMNTADFDCSAGASINLLSGSLHCLNWPGSLTVAPI